MCVKIPLILVAILQERGYVLVTIGGSRKGQRYELGPGNIEGLRAYISSRRKLSWDSFASLPLGNLRVPFREVVSFLLLLLFARTNRNFGARYLRIRVMHPKYYHIR